MIFSFSWRLFLSDRIASRGYFRTCLVSSACSSLCNDADLDFTANINHNKPLCSDGGYLMLCSVSAPFVCQLDLLCVYKRLWKRLYVWQPLLSLSSLGDIVSRPWRRCSGCGWMSAGSGLKCLLPVFKYTFTVIHSSSTSHIIVFTLFCLNPVWSGNNSTACFHITCTTRYIRLNAGSVLGSSEHVDGRMEKWLFCSVQCECVNSTRVVITSARPRSKHKTRVRRCRFINMFQIT